MHTVSTLDASDWKHADARLRELAANQGALDYEIGRWLLRAHELQVHHQLGFGSFGEYVDRVLGYSPHTAYERLRAARALETLPELREALARGELRWSAVRELTRVVVPATERRWIEATRRKTVHDIASMVVGLEPGQLPGEAPDPRRVERVLRFRVPAETYATYREAATQLRTELGADLEEEDVLLELCTRALQGRDDDGRAPYQVALMQCESCERVWQEAGDDSIEVPAEVAEAAQCDGQHIGDVRGEPARARQTLAPRLRRQILRRDHGRCRVPGCRNHRFLHIHHLRLVEDGGDNDPAQLITLCATHHRHVHDGRLYIEGDRERDVRFFYADGRRYGDAPLPEHVEAAKDAFSALRNLGLRETEAKGALAVAMSRVGAEPSGVAGPAWGPAGGGRDAGIPDLVAAALRARADAAV